MLSSTITGFIRRGVHLKLSKLFVDLKCCYSKCTDETFIIAKRTAHLTRDSKQPPDTCKLRLYSMEYCLFCHRVRLVLRAKGVDHEIVNINVQDPPVWYTKINPDGKTPALDTGCNVIVESKDICNYLDKEYSKPALYPLDVCAAKAEMELLAKIDPITDILISIIFQEEKKTASEWKETLLPHLEIFNAELECRDTKYFGGNKPGMVDYILWPLAERYQSIPMTLKEDLQFGPCDIQKLRQWRTVMRDHPVVDGIYNGPEKFYKSILMKRGLIPVDFDTI